MAKRDLSLCLVCLPFVGLAGLALFTQACQLPTNGTGTGVVGPGPIGPDSMWTNKADLSRDGHYSFETVLTPANVTPPTFGKIASLPVDGWVYAQPLVAKGVYVNSALGTRDLLIVATEGDTVYAFDAQALSPTPIWRNNFVGNGVASLGAADVTAPCSGCSTLSLSDTQAPNVAPQVGITATPVIDVGAGVVYVVAPSKENGTFHMRIHALDITTGKELGPSPVEVAGAVSGTGFGSNNGTLVFDAETQLSRSALALYDGTLFFGFSSYDDAEPAHGWLFAYDATMLTPAGQFVTTPNSGLASIWMAGNGPALDKQGNLYFSTGNADANFINPSDLDGSIAKVAFDPNSGLSLADWFTPWNAVNLTNADLDVGSGGVLLLPDQGGSHPHLLVQAGKEGTIYLLDRDNLGHMTSSGANGDANIVQELPRVLSPETPNSFDTGVFGGSVYVNGKVYFAPVQLSLRAFGVNNGSLSTQPVDTANEVIRLRGGGLSVSSNGGNNAIVWMVDASAYTYGWNPNTFQAPTITNGPAVLYAYDANDLSTPLYRSDVQGGVDDAGNAVKFSVPTIAGGHVYVGTQTEVTVYGNLPTRTVHPQPPTNPLPPKLSQTGFFSNLASMTPAQGVLPYDVVAPLWSDGAGKGRWIILPQGSQIGFSPTGDWTFPVGTRFIKQFDLNLGNGVTTRLETRVLTLTSSGWSGATYQWQANQSDANLLSASATQTYTITAANGTTAKQTWYFPSPNDCLSCHNPVGGGGGLGVRTRQLNRTFDYGDGNGPVNQLAHWDQLGMFVSSIGDPSQYDAYAAVGDTSQPEDKRARTYFAVNCSMCHLPGGPAPVSIDFRFDTPLDQMGLVNVAPAKGNMGVNGAYLITPGNAGASVVYLRMDTAGTGRMPPLATSVIDSTAVGVVGDWINSLSMPAAPAANAVHMKRPVSGH